MGSKLDIEVKDLLEKMLSGEITNTEKDHIKSYIYATHKDKELHRFMSLHWDKIGNSQVGMNDGYFNQLRENIWLKVSSPHQLKSTGFRKLMSWKSQLVRIAAILFIPLLVTSIYMSYMLFQQDGFENEIAMQEVFATPGSRVQFTLPDQSKVWLNSGSSLEYSINMNNQRERKVKLTGQGYFDIRQNKQQPFIVETGELNIRVLGTSFDVSNYLNDKRMTATLEHGAIVLLDRRGDEVARLVPGQQAMLDKESRKLLVKEVDTGLITSWKDGRLIFKNTPLQEVTKQLERWFNCSIDVAPGLLRSDVLYTATIQDETLVEVLKMIEISTRVKTKIENRKVTIME
jgi:ferric-dicitrate binding protein FerR (iron transport regulator)